MTAVFPVTARQVTGPWMWMVELVSGKTKKSTCPLGSSPLGPLVASIAKTLKVKKPTSAGPPVRVTESCVGGGDGSAALEMLGKAKATPTIAVVRISVSLRVAPLDESPWRFVV
jgi:hypothetical protein